MRLSTLLLCLILSTPIYAERVGFLVISPDRGYYGNQGVRELFEDYQRDFPISNLVFIPYKNPEPLIQKELQDLKEKRVHRIVALPLFLSHHDLYFKKAKEILTNHQSLFTSYQISFVDPMSESYLIAEILVDRVQALSKDPDNEALFLIGIGASDEKAVLKIETDLNKVLEWSQSRFKMKEMKVFVFYDYNVEQEQRIMDRMKMGIKLDGKNPSSIKLETPKETKKVGSTSMIFSDVIQIGNDSNLKERIKDELEITERQGGRAILIPFFIGLKFSPMMSQWKSFINELNNSELRNPQSTLRFGQELLPHPNVLLWLKKKSHEALSIQKDEIGIVLASHGGDIHWNQELLEVCKPLENEYNVEHAFGMIEPETIGNAVDRLVEGGAKAVLLLRIFALEMSFEEKAKYILGLRKDPLTYGGMMPERIQTSALLYTNGGLEDDPLYAEALLDRAKEISKDPPNEIVILVSHGKGNDRDNDYWLQIMESLAQQMKEKGGDQFFDIRGAALREDWSNKREKAVGELRNLIEKETNKGRDVLVIANRINGPGPTQSYLQGLDYRFNGEGFLPHPNFIKIIRRQIEEGITEIVKK
jgi:sirohydrochlorin ferrochelatase